MTVQTYNTNIRQYVWKSVNILLDRYFLYGFLYDRKGHIEMDYINPGCEILEDGSEGPLMGADGYPLLSERYLVDNPYEVPDKFQAINHYLDVHSCETFSYFDYLDVEGMSYKYIAEKIIGSYCIDKLIAMLRRGKNYAMDEPIDECVSDEYLKDMICFAWKEKALHTIRIRDLKSELSDSYTDSEMKDRLGERQYLPPKNKDEAARLEKLILRVIEKSLSEDDKKKRIVNIFSGTGKSDAAKDFIDMMADRIKRRETSIVYSMVELFDAF